MTVRLAHIFDTGAGVSPWWFVVGALVVAVLIAEHHVVAGFDRQQLARRCRVATGVFLVAALSAVGAPTGDAQSAGALLPDLISDPPRPSFFNELNTPDGQTRLVITFDGYVHNIGEGALDLVGNPQETNGMRQRVLNGDAWEDVGTPTVKFETDDGHNHFHLMETIEYVLWNELQGTQTAIGSKVGFCLVDSEQLEPGYDQAYSEELDNFCQQNNPEATSLRMGITTGWRDVYDATTTLQWVDVSNVAPGRYWIGAITDPNNEILESNEDNNDLIFSDHTMSVPGFSPRSQLPIAVADNVVEFTLTSSVHGSVTRPVYVIEQGPASGVLDVPIGSDLGSATVRYFPEPGFVGSDQIVFSVHDAASPYPFDRPTQTIEFQVTAGAGQASDQTADSNTDLAPSLVAPSTFFETDLGQTFSVDIDATDFDGQPARIFATGLPAGLIANADNGTISGVAVEEGIFPVELIAIGATPDEVTSLAVTWIVNPADSSVVLGDVIAQSSPRRELTRLRVGVNTLGAMFEAEGLPPGLSLEEGSPVISGTPTEAGTSNVVVRQLDGTDVIAETSFEWTIRPTVNIDFAL